MPADAQPRPLPAVAMAVVEWRRLRAELAALVNGDADNSRSSRRLRLQVQLRQAEEAAANCIQRAIAAQFGANRLWHHDDEQAQWNATRKAMAALATDDVAPGAISTYVYRTAERAISDALRRLKRERNTIRVDPTDGAQAPDGTVAAKPWDADLRVPQHDDALDAARHAERVREAMAAIWPDLVDSHRFVLEWLVVEGGRQTALAEALAGPNPPRDLHRLHGGAPPPCSLCRNWVDVKFKQAKAAVAKKVQAYLAKEAA